MTAVICIENLCKTYRLGQIGTGTFAHDLNIMWAKLRGKPNPLQKIGHENLSTREGETLLALNNVSFSVQQGEVLGIIGRNGAGKSTLLKILSRITAPTSGTVKIKGRVASLLEVGTGFHPEMTGRENIFLNGAILGMNRKEITRKFDEIVDFAEVSAFIDTPVKRYSSGMYVRLAFAVAAHLEPEILVIDEVLAVGDAGFQQKCLGKMSGIAGEGRTILFVSHNMAAVRKLCPRALLLSEGSVIFIGDTDSVIARYLLENRKSDSCCIDLPPQKNQDGGQGKGIRLLIKNVAGSLGNTFKIGEKWNIQFSFEITKNLTQVVAGIGFTNNEGVPIVTLWTQPADLIPGKYYADFECDLPLKAMLLSVHVGLSSQERPFYYVQDVGTIEICAVSTQQQPFRATGAGILLGNQNSRIHSAPE
jgi:ABC-type polysaccharide/polyol phosphate transport system ATPase subunit